MSKMKSLQDELINFTLRGKNEEQKAETQKTIEKYMRGSSQDETKREENKPFFLQPRQIADSFLQAPIPQKELDLFVGDMDVEATKKLFSDIKFGCFDENHLPCEQLSGLELRVMLGISEWLYTQKEKSEMIVWYCDAMEISNPEGVIAFKLAEFTKRVCGITNGKPTAAQKKAVLETLERLQARIAFDNKKGIISKVDQYNMSYHSFQDKQGNLQKLVFIHAKKFFRNGLLEEGKNWAYLSYPSNDVYNIYQVLIEGDAKKGNNVYSKLVILILKFLSYRKIKNYKNVGKITWNGEECYYIDIEKGELFKKIITAEWAKNRKGEREKVYSKAVDMLLKAKYILAYQPYIKAGLNIERYIVSKALVENESKPPKK